MAALDRIDPVTGLPRGIVRDGPSEKERKAVAICRAKVEAALNLWKIRKPKVDELEDMLAGEGWDASPPGSGKVALSKENAALLPPDVDRTETNLFLRTQMGLKAQAADPNWRVQCSGRGDLPDDKIEEIESLHERIVTDAELPREFSDCLDDGGTSGVAAVYYAIDRAINRAKMEGSSTPISDLVSAAANGDTTVHPKPGMDFLSLADSARAFSGDPGQMANRTLDQHDNLERLAAEADQMWVDEMEKSPEGYAYGGIMARRVKYFDDMVWDSRMSTRWQDARWVAFFHSFTIEEAQAEESWKPSARSKLAGIVAPNVEGIPEVASPSLSKAENDAISTLVRVMSFWDRDTGEVHWFSEATQGGYEGFLERDSRYPYLDAKGRSIFKDWFPMRACTPVTHNKRKPERCFGKPWLEPGKSKARQYNLFDTALTAGRRRAGRIIELPSGLPPEIKDAIEGGSDLVTIERPGEIDEKTPLIYVHEFGKTPVDLEAGKQAALSEYAACVDMSIEEISGISLAPTLGQAEKASAGSASRRGGLIRKLEAFAGEIVRDLGQLAKRFYTEERVTELMGAAFTARKPVMVPDPMTGGPVPMIDPVTKEPVLLPSTWDLFKASSPAGDSVTVTFSTRSDDLMRAKSADDFMALAATPAGLDAATGFPMWDMRPIWEREAKARGFGRLKPFQPPEPMPVDGDGADSENPKEDKAEGGNPPQGGGDPTGRGARGSRGAPVPGRQGRGEGPGDVGDHSTTANRVSTQ